MKIITKSPEETKKLGEKLAQGLKNGGVACFWGDLGSGKTTLIQGIARSFGFKRITSPTFIICRRYNKFFWHIDLYRLTSLAEAKAIGLEEILADPKNIVLIEWPEIIKKILPAKSQNFFLKTLADNIHEIIY